MLFDGRDGAPNAYVSTSIWLLEHDDPIPSFQNANRSLPPDDPKWTLTRTVAVSTSMPDAGVTVRQ